MLNVLAEFIATVAVVVAFDCSAGLLTFRNCYFKDINRVSLTPEFGLVSGSNESTPFHIANETLYDRKYNSRSKQSYEKSK